MADLFRSAARPRNGRLQQSARKSLLLSCGLLCLLGEAVLPRGGMQALRFPSTNRIMSSILVPLQAHAMPFLSDRESAQRCQLHDVQHAVASGRPNPQRNYRRCDS